MLGFFDMHSQAVKEFIDLATADWMPRKTFLTVRLVGTILIAVKHLDTIILEKCH